jgi:SAM-dependent methyltransferase
MFDGKYFDWNQKRVKAIVDFYGYKFFYFKRILDLGCGYGDVGGVFYRLGSDVTGVDARQEHLKVLSKKFTGIKTVQANLDDKWPFHGQKFDLILDLGLICHLSNFEHHLQAVCSSCTHLVLETAVCDSDDPYKVVAVDEDRSIYDLAYGGKGCRPSPAAVERVLRDCGMNFKRMDSSKFNSADYSYDWYPRNENATSMGKRRIWFCVKDSSPIQFANPSSEIAHPPITMESFTRSLPDVPAPASQGYITPIVNSGIPAQTAASPKPPMSARMEAEARAKAAANNPQGGPGSMPDPSPIRTRAKTLSLNDKIRFDSREFGLITPDDFTTNVHADVRGTILPNTHSSRMWFKKIAPVFPNIKLSNKVLSMPGFAKVDVVPDLVMCSLDNLQSHNRVWIDEWVGPALTEEHVQILKKCHAIVTPSLLNAEEIWQHIPYANVYRVNKPWPAIEVEPAQGKYFIYFEKVAVLTEALLKAWNPEWGDLAVVGASVKLPTFAKYISDSEPYTQIMKLIHGSKAVIDLSENNYYLSGIIGLATDIGKPVITNNHVNLDSNLVLVGHNKRASINPTSADIRVAVEKFLAPRAVRANTYGVKTHNDNFLVAGVRKMVGI